MEQEHALRRLGLCRNRGSETQQQRRNPSRTNRLHFALSGPWCCTSRPRAGFARGEPVFVSRRTPERARPQPVAIIMRAWGLVSGLAAACLLAEPAVAQVSEPTPAAAQTAPGLEEVIVTAQRRPENIQTVPLSIVAFSADSLRQLGMTVGFDLANQVPNMNIDAPTGDSTVRYFLRGVGTQDFNTLATSPIALYVDDVYLGSA